MNCPYCDKELAKLPFDIQIAGCSGNHFWFLNEGEPTYGYLRPEVTKALVKLREVVEAVQDHANQQDDDRCWVDTLVLYERVLGKNFVPPKISHSRSDLMESCWRHWDQETDPRWSLCPQGMTIRQLEDEVSRLRKQLGEKEI